MPASNPAAVVVLAAGQGTRMRSSLPKVMHRVAGRTLLGHAIAAVQPLQADQTVVVVRHDRDVVAGHVAEVAPDVLVADQDEVPGTGRALWCGLLAMDEARRAAGLAPLSGRVLVTYGDVPLITTATLERLLAADPAAAVSVLTSRPADPTGYGRVLRGPDGQVTQIVEHKDADEQQRAVREVNSGVYAIDLELARQVLPALRAANAQGEQYLTDVVGAARDRGLPVVAVAAEDPHEVDGVNDRVQLAAAGARLNQRLLVAHMLAGVTVLDPATTWVDAEVSLAQDVTLLPGTQLLGGTSVAAGAVVGPDTTLLDCRVGAAAEVVRSHGSGAVIGAGAVVGPFSFLRPGTELGADGKIGAFVETKNAVIGEGSKVPHLSYVGDATIGEGSNIGAATIFANYDGVAKHRTTVGDHVRVGSDSVLVAPVSIGDGAYTAAGTVVRKDVPSGALAMSVAAQRNLEGWVEQRREGSAAAAAARAARAGTRDQHADDQHADNQAPDDQAPDDAQGAHA